MSEYKKIIKLAAVAAVLSSGPVHAAVIGPDAFGYTATTVTSAFQDIRATGTRVLAGVDDGTVAASIGFSFDFYGTGFSELFISSNGLLSFAQPNSAFSNTDLSVDDRAMPIIAPLWDDWRFFTSNDAAYYQTTGSTGSREFVVQWHETLHFSRATNPLTVTFQAVLFETSNNILFRYLDVDTGGSIAFGSSATVGIADTNGATSGNNLIWSFNSPVISDGQAILFSTGRGTFEVPETSTLGLLGLGLVAFGLRSVRRKRG